MCAKAAALTDEQLDHPIEVSVQGIDPDPTIRSLLSRLVGQMDMWNAAMVSEPYDYDVERHEPIGSMLPRLDRAGGALDACVRDISECHGHEDTFVDATGDAPYVFTAAGMIAHVITHAA